MKINKITKTNSGKYKVLIDDKEITTYDEVLLNNKILYKKNIDDELYEKLSKDNNYYEAYNKTVSYIMKHKRCVYEIEQYLKKYELTEEETTKIIEKLKSIGLINEKLYVSSYISDKLNFSNDGPNKLKENLLKLHIDEDIILDELSKIDKSIFIDKIEKYVTKNKKNNSKYSLYKFKQKITYELISLGYDMDLILPIIDSIKYDESNVLEIEYNKIKNKLSKKFSGKELKNKISQKLYAKGFDINIINEYIQKIEE